MCVGSIDGTHISIEPPCGEETDYYNYQKFHSVIALVLVDSTSKFTYLNVSVPGRCNDASVYSRSTLFRVIQDPLYARHRLSVNNAITQAHLIGDSAFPLSQHLMKPFPGRVNMPQDRLLFSYRLSHCRTTVERAFGHLKNRVRSLHKKLEYDLDHTKPHAFCTTSVWMLKIQSTTNGIKWHRRTRNLDALYNRWLLWTSEMHCGIFSCRIRCESALRSIK